MKRSIRAVGVDDPERGVLRADERPHLVDDHLEDIVDRLQSGDARTAASRAAWTSFRLRVTTGFGSSIQHDNSKSESLADEIPGWRCSSTR